MHVMALKDCKECGAQVSTEAEACPHCGVPAPTQDMPAPQATMGRTTYNPAFHHPFVRFNAKGAFVVPWLQAILRNTAFGIIAIVFAGLGLVFLVFAHWLFYGIFLLVAAAGALVAIGELHSAWSGCCPYCQTNVFTRASSTIATHGFDCPTCKHRIILKDKRFNTLDMILSETKVNHNLPGAAQKTRSTAFDLAVTLAALAIIAVVIIAIRAL